MSSTNRPMHLLLAEQVPAGSYCTPTAIQSVSITMPVIEGSARIHLALVDGYALEIPMTQNAMESLYQFLRSMVRRP